MLLDHAVANLIDKMKNLLAVERSGQVEAADVGGTLRCG